MTLSITTLEKTKEILTTEMKEIGTQIKEIEKSSYISYKNFTIQGIRRSWRFTTAHQVEYDITFKHNSQDVSIEICTEGTPDRISWAGWSYDSIKPEEFVNTITKGKEYIEAVHEMLCMCERIDEVKKVIEQALSVYTSSDDLRKKEEILNDQIDEINEQIHTINNDEIYNKAIELFSSKVYLAENYILSNRSTLSYIQISLDKKGNPLVDVRGKSRKIDKYTVISLYNHATKYNIKEEIDWDKEYDDPTRRRYYKYPNMFITSDERTYDNYMKIKEEITREEYDNIRYKR